MYVYVALPKPVGAWSITLGLRQCMEYYEANAKSPMAQELDNLQTLPFNKHTFEP